MGFSGILIAGQIVHKTGKEVERNGERKKLANRKTDQQTKRTRTNIKTDKQTN